MSKTRVFIIGNGLSMGVANTPHTRELVDRLLEDYESNNGDEKNDNDERGFQALRGFRETLETMLKEATSIPPVYKDYISKNDYKANDLEYILSLIDLDLSSPLSVKPNLRDSDAESTRLTIFENFRTQDLEDIRYFIGRRLVKLLSPSRIQDKTGVLETFCRNYVADGDTFIVFNYDVLLEQALWKVGKWSPLDGYTVGKVIGAETNSLSQNESTNLKRKSKCTILKMHGSVNWLQKSTTFRLLDLEITLRDETGDCYLESLTLSGKGAVWQDREMILPSYIKYYEFKESGILIKNAIDALTSADEVYIIGYSFPPADSISHMLLSSINAKAKIYLICKDSGSNVKRMLKGLGVPSVLNLGKAFEDWVNSGFPLVDRQEEILKQLMSLH